MERAYTVLGNSLCAKLGLILSQSNTSGIASKVLGGVGNERSPSTANIKQTVKVIRLRSKKKGKDAYVSVSLRFSLLQTTASLLS